jgi:uncharacterized cupredoxin-like copper-binding protein
MHSRHLKVVFSLGVALLLGACTTGEARKPADEAQAQSPAAQEVVVYSRDFVFQAPDTVFSGLTTFRLINEGPDFHHILLARLEDGHTMEDLYDLDPHAPPPAWLRMVGGPNTPGLPGEETNATLVLEPGNYAMLCVIPAADGQPHTSKGMIKPLTVIPANAPSAPMPAADLVMVLDDYSFDTDKPVTAGRRTIRLENPAEQPHEVVFVQLAPGKTAADFLQFMHEPQGEPPGKVVGGNTPMAKGEVNQITIDFEPGEYALLCMMPDLKDGAPHVVHGMVKQITVR